MIAPLQRKSAMRVDGQCHCGKIAYEAEVDPPRSAICNCADCQTFSGSPWRASVPARAEDFRMLRGAPKAYVKVADSGAKRVQAFCGDCGSAIYSTSVDSPTIFNLRLGALKQRADLPPRRQIWMDSALAWVQDISRIPGAPRG
jgi:hypothetical protein